RMALQPARADRERNRWARRARVEEQQPTCDARVGWKLAGLPPGTRRHRHELSLCVEPGQRPAEPPAQRHFEGGEGDHRRVFFERVVFFLAGVDPDGLSDRSESSPTLNAYAFTQLYSRTAL